LRLLAARGDANERAEPKGQLYWDCLKAQVCVKLHGLVALVVKFDTCLFIFTSGGNDPFFTPNKKNISGISF